GKTTILRLVGGFTQPTGGAIAFGSADITRLPTHRRPFNTVFQDYALFPHMSVEANVGYGLRIRRRPSAEIRRRAGEALDMVGLGGFGGRMPAQLSGGQRQRVALARAIVCEPKVILLDEPLAALDAELRRQMQLFLKHLQRTIRTTFLFVTHDQEEAITMSDRIVVMRAGGIEQIGAPRDLYYRPATRFVAGFFGKSNLIPGRLVGADRVETPLGLIPAPGISPGLSGAVMVSIRPERLTLAGDPPDFAIPATIDEVVFSGATTRVLLRPRADPSSVLTCEMRTDATALGMEKGAEVVAQVAAGDVVVVRNED
ncbi:MAG: ABC transporter ATP-binding protein, partial [Rhizobiaceae bacterium]|nr:ABC transporter ATP-binding protein [Rhizobiaceae bacterium]